MFMYGAGYGLGIAVLEHAAWLIEDGGCSPEDLSLIREAVARLDADDPTGARRAWERGSAARAAWIADELRTPGAGARIAARFDERGVPLDELPDPTMRRDFERVSVLRLDPQPAARMTNAELAARLDNAQTNRTSIIARWDDFDAEVYVRNARRDDSQVTKFVTEMFESYRDGSLKARARLAQVKALLR